MQFQIKYNYGNSSQFYVSMIIGSGCCTDHELTSSDRCTSNQTTIFLTDVSLQEMRFYPNPQIWEQ
ncbi:hypothetical protein Nos7524_2574 [Nostoc sp. PCC 7524]|uniref:hypothetical protein n=1 Tax=Nostoc sp. (strain ATCC 29411 / PCC 7524) TaxID=28072 RepID=UPI00029F0FDA|nr:hypothetical protein [Nostoc sp. PCC 7524]AFY48411.1 hypothetical protein Nos7524_2574 [Nostoc sp. PCC 7524]